MLSVGGFYKHICRIPTASGGLMVHFTYKKVNAFVLKNRQQVKTVINLRRGKLLKRGRN
jgi:hypothetical protein